MLGAERLQFLSRALTSAHGDNVVPASPQLRDERLPERTRRAGNQRPHRRSGDADEVRDRLPRAARSLMVGMTCQ